MKQFISPLLKIGLCTISYLWATSSTTQAQVTSDGTVNTQVNQNGNVAEITGGEARGSNLFHSFQDFSVPTGNEAFFNNATDIANILSRVTGGNISNIDGLIRANGTANLFLINPAGIIFGENASLNLGGSFYGSSADSLLFPDGIEFSATDTQAQPILTINAPIGLGFRDNPGDIVNRSMVTDDDSRSGLSVAADQTLALIGGNIFIDGGTISTSEGRIELGSVAENSTVSLTTVEQGFDFGYEEVANFQDISLSNDALVTSSGANTGDIEVQGRNISLTEGSSIGLNTNESQVGNIDIIAAESLTLEGIGLNDFPNVTEIFSNVSGDATGEGSAINIDTPILTMTNDAFLGGFNNGGTGQGVDVNINAAEIIAETSLIFSQVFEEGTGDGGDITINTDKLTLNEGGQISTTTFGPGNGGNIVVNASDSIELNGTFPDIENNDPSTIGAIVGIPLVPIPTAGNGGNITINTPRLVVSDGAQIQSFARNNGNGGNLTINASDSILLTETSPSAELQGLGRSGIIVSAEPSYEEVVTDFETFEQTLTGEIIPTTGNGGSLTLNTGKLIIEQGAFISADALSLGNGGNTNINVNELILRDGGQITAGSLIQVDNIDTERGDGGTLNITATESVKITGIGDINNEPVNSSMFTLAESNGNAGNITLTTSKLNISDGGDINASAVGEGAAGMIEITADEINLDNGDIFASTTAGDGGNVTLEIADNLTLRNNSLISARAFEEANGGNVNINSEFIIAFPSQPPGEGNDIIASAEEGMGGNITINAESLFGIEPRDADPENGTNDISASSEVSGLEGTVNINSSDINPIQGVAELPQNIVVPEQTTAQACQTDRLAGVSSGLTIEGKGGIPPEPGLPLDSHNISVNGQNNSTFNIPAPIETAQGKIQPARGVIVTESGEIILTAYRTNNAGVRLTEIKPNCS